MFRIRIGLVLLCVYLCQMWKFILFRIRVLWTFKALRRLSGPNKMLKCIKRKLHSMTFGFVIESISFWFRLYSNCIDDNPKWKSTDLQLMLYTEFNSGISTSYSIVFSLSFRLSCRFLPFLRFGFLLFYNSYNKLYTSTKFKIQWKWLKHNAECIPFL